MTAEWPLVGRQEELEFVARSLGAADSAGVLVAGSAGIGKTRLARAALSQIGPTADCEWVVATEALRTIPFGALAHLVPSPTPGDRRIQVARSDRFDLLRAAIADIRGRANQTRFVIGVDDAHLLDDDAAALLHQLAVMRSVKLVLTTRSGESAPDPLVALWKDGLVERLEIQPLSPLEVDELVTAVLGGQVERRTLQRLAEASGGNALLLRELVEAAFDNGTLEASNSVWVWRGEVRASPRLRDLIEARMAQLGGPERRVVETLAVGEPLPVGILEELDREAELGDLERRGFIRVDDAEGQEPIAVLAHPLQAEVLRAALPISGRRAIQRRLADAVKGTPIAGPEDALRRALWVLDSGAALDPEVLVAAAQTAADRLNFAIAERLAKAALAAKNTPAGVHFDAALCLAEALAGQSRYEEAETTAAPLAGLATNDLDRTRVALARRVN
ncbi:MAG TPA: AAA family ATPase, partial [Acidimicrobiales bacterium]|nr:AAA family ATPase [Acidimicrobiales bacterium]